MKSEFPEVEWATQAYEGGFTLKKGEEYVREQNVLFVDEDFFKVFSVEAVAGHPSAALENPNTLLLTEEAAERYFGADPNVVGRTIQQNDGKDWRVGGVVKKWPEQSHLQFDFLASLKNVLYRKAKRPLGVYELPYLFYLKRRRRCNGTK